jgi:DNA ligase 4
VQRKDLEGIYRRLQPKEAKWFTRLVLKDFQPIILEPNLVFRCYDALLPTIRNIHDDFSVSLSIMQKLRASGSVGSNQSRKVTIKNQEILQLVKPRLGVKVGRQPWYKARSIKHCLDMGHGQMSCEKKIDGEYCQIHIDLSKGRDCIQIFSKSGKDSTEDRVALHRYGVTRCWLCLPIWVANFS